ncbi:gustatory and pheromone receptor 33a isoform X2 [Drosophila novamexicana]|uniref:gustatory and pheromone receptor 33a isoform X2 n=1 Tax=Drosophila novamexicana TaxID=47314 RepID=UPI0011E5E779|nr:gustatory and pheromone receptor 33a isoform X2 [Drosophila novamexicana]
MIQVMNWLSMAIGLIPLNRQQLQSNFILDYIMMLIMPCLYLASYLGINLFHRFGLPFLDDCNSVCRLSNNLFMHIGAFLYVTVILLSLYRRKQFFVDFETRLAEIDVIIQKCRRVAELDKMRSQAVKHSVAYHFTWLFVFSVFIFALYYDSRELYLTFGEYAIIPFMVSSFPYLAGSIIQGEFIYHVSVISNRFEQINKLFEKINQEARHRHAPLTVFDIESEGKKQEQKPTPAEKAAATKAIFSNEPKLADELKRQKAQPPKQEDEDELNTSDEEDDDIFDYNDGMMGENTDSTSEANLPDLFKLHDKILALSVITNGEFGPQCVPYMAACFVVSIFGIFLETKVNFIVSGKSRLLDYVTYLYVIWSFTTMVVAYIVLRLCCNANNHSKQSAMIVHEIMQKKPAFMLSNDLFYNKMKSFTLQFLHWEGYFQFNGIGLFALDYTFIFSTVSAATSYLIVLLQFDMTSILRNEGLMT